MKICQFVVSGLLAVMSQAASSQGQSKFQNVSITVPARQFNELKQASGSKTDLTNVVLIVNRDTAKVKEVHSRGNNSLKFERKSLAVDLSAPVSIDFENEPQSVKRFDLLNLVMDKNLWHNRWAFSLMNRLELFPLHNAFSILRINGEMQGIYLIIEKPRNYSSNSKSPYMLRRGVDHKVDAEYTDGSDAETGKKFRKQYDAIYDDIHRYKGEELFTRLNSKLNLDKYFSWLAFNYLIMNGDYADEVYFYIPFGKEKFDVIPWDYDDILRPVPHEGLQARNAIMKDKFIFSSEDLLDRAIASDAFLYDQYLKSCRTLLETLTQAVLENETKKVREELQSANSVLDAGRNSLYLGKDPFQWETASADIQLSLDFIIKRRNALLTQLEK